MKTATAALLLGLLLILAAGLAVACGGEAVYSPARLFELLAAGPGGGSGGAGARDWSIIVHLRLPRVFCAALVGGALALAGVLMQGLFRNPLASPGILGATSGGTFAAVVAISAGLGELSLFLVPACAFLGTLLAIVIVYALASHGGRFSATHLILCGVAVNTIFSAGASLVLTLDVAQNEVTRTREIVRWLTGGLGNRGWEHAGLVAPFIALALAGAAFVARDLNLLLSGEESAQALGVRLESLKRRAITLAALATGAAVSAAGMVGFVGLVAPHIVRLALGPDNRRLVVTATLFGAGFLVLADLAAVKVLYPEEVQLGIVTSLIGGPFFLYLLLRERRRELGE